MLSNASLQDADRDFFLGIYRAAVDFYQPRIERKTGILLGSILVWDYDQLFVDQLQLYSGPWLKRVFRRIFFHRRWQLLIEYGKRCHEENASKCCAVYFQNGIYISLGGNTPHEDMIAVTVVHELSHALWERLATKPLYWKPTPEHWESYQLFVEGFATYAERVWFLDLYPLSIRQSVRSQQYDPEGVHYQGFLRIQELVKQHGSEILPQIPRRWKELAQTTKK